MVDHNIPQRIETDQSESRILKIHQQIASHLRLKKVPSNTHFHSIASRIYACIIIIIECSLKCAWRWSSNKDSFRSTTDLPMTIWSFLQPSLSLFSNNSGTPIQGVIATSDVKNILPQNMNNILLDKEPEKQGSLHKSKCNIQLNKSTEWQYIIIVSLAAKAIH